MVDGGTIEKLDEAVEGANEELLEAVSANDELKVDPKDELVGTGTKVDTGDTKITPVMDDELLEDSPDTDDVDNDINELEGVSKMGLLDANPEQLVEDGTDVLTDNETVLLLKQSMWKTQKMKTMSLISSIKMVPK